VLTVLRVLRGVFAAGFFAAIFLGAWGAAGRFGAVFLGTSGFGTSGFGASGVGASGVSGAAGIAGVFFGVVDFFAMLREP
jgi:hypothetical protein